MTATWPPEHTLPNAAAALLLRLNCRQATSWGVQAAFLALQLVPGSLFIEVESFHLFRVSVPGESQNLVVVGGRAACGRPCCAQPLCHTGRLGRGGHRQRLQHAQHISLVKPIVMPQLYSESRLVQNGHANLQLWTRALPVNCNMNMTTLTAVPF